MAIIDQEQFEYVRRIHSGSTPSAPDTGYPVIFDREYDLGGGRKSAAFVYDADAPLSPISGPAPGASDHYRRVVSQRHDGAAPAAPLNGFLFLRSRTDVVTASPDVKLTRHFYDPLQPGLLAPSLRVDSDTFTVDDTTITADQTETN